MTQRELTISQFDFSTARKNTIVTRGQCNGLHGPFRVKQHIDHWHGAFLETSNLGKVSTQEGVGAGQATLSSTKYLDATAESFHTAQPLQTSSWTAKHIFGYLSSIPSKEEDHLGLKAGVDSNRIRFTDGNREVLVIPTSAVADITYGQDVHRRVGAAIGLAVVSFGIGGLQPLFERGLWMFGPEFESVEFTSNRSMTTVVRQFFERGGVDASRSRPDFVVLPDSSVGLYCGGATESDRRA
jgi:hypothetical protein